jgi:DNA-binding response OmpR family regulator
MKGIVLIVDDDVNTRVIAETLLSTKGFEVRWAADAAQALAVLANGGADVTVLDLTLSSKNDWEVIRSLRREGASPIVIMTDRPDPELSRFSLHAGAHAFLRKPLAPTDFVHAIEYVMAANRAGSVAV